MPDVVVVGAGVIGASVAWHLSRLGVRTLLLEREPEPGKGSTGRATGGFRAQYGTDINVRLSLLSREKLRRFIDDTGVDPGYDPRGYLWLARTEAQLDILRGAQDVQLAAGLVEASMLDLRQIREVNPYIRLDGLAGAAFCPTDGYIRPLDILRGYLRGAQVRTSARVTGLRRRGSRIEAVQLADGSEIPAGAVVDAAGPWAGPVARLAGVDVPVAPLRRQVGSTVDTEVLPAAMPMTVWVEDAFHVRARDGRVLLVWPTPGDPRDPESTAVEQDWLEQVREKAAERVPPLAGIPVDPTRSWAGLYEMSPDQHALLGRAPECDNLYLCNGSSGHGVMHSPALGQLLAEIIVHGQSRSLDVEALRPSRFAEGRPNRATQIL
ncbi:MAG: FAD-binding oxidoreductase [Deltaproteobacteria bacterium]|nr:MAG: FAD-binding oxidoreductase [Deltaproteobacteria bacterium]TMB38367.1 MAG: FAD-binding oxidoreductase [Deltaproteobacteria bacterium]